MESYILLPFYNINFFLFRDFLFCLYFRNFLSLFFSINFLSGSPAYSPRPIGQVIFIYICFSRFNLACLRTKKNEDVISSSLQVYILQRVDRGFIIVDQTGYCKLRISDDESKSNVPQIGLYYRLKSFKWHNWEIHLTKKSLKPFKYV